MDLDNIADLKAMAPPECHAKILLLGNYDPECERIIRDPYCDIGSEGFEKCYQQCVRCCNEFLEQVEKNSSI
jgi:low molecular weight phosphotyrosine protein phosphatase